jgi:Phosphodiester glycosidase
VALHGVTGDAVAVALGAPAGSVPSFSVDPVSKRSEVTFTRVDPLTTPLEVAVVADGGSSCFGGSRRGNGCFDRISAMVGRHGAAAGLTANFSNGVDILGLAVAGHHAYSPPDPHTTSLCVGDGTPGATRPTVTITREADAIRCRAAVSGERIVTAGRVDVEGRADAGRRGAFWWSVEPGSRVQRTAVGLAQDGTLLLAVVSATRDGQRNGMTLDAAARWLIRQGAVDAISLDGGHQAEAYVSGRGPIVPLQAGEPRVQVSLLLGRTVPVTAPPPPPPAPPPPPPAPALPPPPAPVGPGPATASGGDGTASRTSAVSSGVDGTDGPSPGRSGETAW